MTNPWLTWFKAAVVPSLVMLVLAPIIVYKLEPPTITSTPEAPEQVLINQNNNNIQYTFL